jgi:hypothetical protein
MKIHQLSVTYLAEQDRILVRVNTASAEEMRLWLTRRLMLGLWPLLSKLLTKHLLKLEAAGTSLDTADEDLKKMLADFRKEEFLRHADFETPYKEEQAVLPLGEEPLLVTDVDASPLPNGRLRLSFNEKPPEAEKPRSFQMEMEPKLILRRAGGGGGWDRGGRRPDVPAQAPLPQLARVRPSGPAKSRRCACTRRTWRAAPPG